MDGIVNIPRKETQTPAFKGPEKANSLEELVNECPKNLRITESMLRSWHIINNPKYEKILCSISGGSDSDILLDMCYRCDKDNKIDYVWYDTGVEYQATKDHLQYLEKKYKIEMIRTKPAKSVPLCCKQFGQPFVSKRVSDFIDRLQCHDFQWEDEPFDVLCEKYPNCTSALRWWCNEGPDNSYFTINMNKWLKEFIIENPPQFNISSKCCLYTKKLLVKQVIKDGGYGLNIFGVRKSERGSRTFAYRSCFSEEKEGYDSFRPLYWLTNDDKAVYNKHYGISNSKCYTEYGFTRTGCVGCPFNIYLEGELEATKWFEPKLYKAACNIFGDSYEYTRKYREFAKEHKEKSKAEKRAKKKKQ